LLEISHKQAVTIGGNDAADIYRPGKHFSGFPGRFFMAFFLPVINWILYITTPFCVISMLKIQQKHIFYTINCCRR